MIESVESFPSKLQFPPFSKRKGFHNGKIQIVYDACEKGVAAHSRGVRQPYAFDPMNICGINADNYIGQYRGCCNRYCKRMNDSAGIQWGVRIADVRTVYGGGAICISVGAVDNGERRAGLK